MSFATLPEIDGEELSYKIYYLSIEHYEHIKINLARMTQPSKAGPDRRPEHAQRDRPARKPNLFVETKSVII